MDVLNEEPFSPQQPSRRVAWSRFLPWYMVVLFVAVVAAGVLDALFVRGWYLLLIVPMAAALVLAAAIHLAVTWGHCRNRMVAALAGLLAAGLMYLGQYQFDLVRQGGPQFLWRVDLLPKFVALRKKIEKQEKLGAQVQPNPAAAQQKPNVFGNWYMFGAELLFVLFVGTYTGYSAAGRPYCDRCRRWRRREVVFFPLHFGPQIVRAVNEDRLETLATLPSIPPPQQGSYAAVVLGWCPPRGADRVCPAYLSVKGVRRGGGPTQYSQIDAVFGRTLLAERPLSTAQLAKLLTRFSELSRLVRGAEQQQRRIEGQESAGDGATAEVKPVAGVDAGKILSRQTMLLGNLLSLIPLLLLAAALVLTLIGFFGLTGADKTTRMAVKGTSAVLWLAGGLMIRDVGWLSRRLLLRRARAAIGLRGDALVRPDDPDALFVQVVPRERWGKLSLDVAGDVGFAKLDARRRELLFEGDRQRYRIPSDAILTCEVEKVVYGTAREPYETCIFLSVLRARGQQGVFELPLGQRADLSRKTAAARRQWAEQFCRRILAIAPDAKAEA